MNVVKLLDDRMTSRPYIGLYGSLAVMHKIQIEKKTYQIPLTLDSNVQDCLNNGLYRDVFPNDKYASTFFFVQVGKTKQSEFRRNVWQFQKDFKLIGWYNCEKLGFENNDLTDLIYGDLFTYVFNPPIANEDEKANIKLKVSTYGKDVPSELSQYGSFLSKNWEMYPYGFIEVNFSIEYLSNCFDEITIGKEIECISFNGALKPVEA